VDTVAWGELDAAVAQWCAWQRAEQGRGRWLRWSGGKQIGGDMCAVGGFVPERSRAGAWRGVGPAVARAWRSRAG
jgi:hypothetical protein